MGEAKHNFKKHGRASVKTVCYILCRLMIPDGSQMENISHWFAVIFKNKFTGATPIPLNNIGIR
jgi:hypothetical protein